MSNLLKKNMEPEIAAFGFPVIQRAPWREEKGPTLRDDNRPGN